MLCCCFVRVALRLLELAKLLNYREQCVSTYQVWFIHDSRAERFIHHGEMDRCGESQAWTTACSSMPRTWRWWWQEGPKGEDNPKQADSRSFARHSWLAKSGANLYHPGGCRVVFLFRCYACFVFVSFPSFLFSLNPRSFVQFSRSSLFDMHASWQLHTVT